MIRTNAIYVLDVLNIPNQIKLRENSSIISKQNVNLMWNIVSFRRSALVYKECENEYIQYFSMTYFSVTFNRNNN